MSDECGETYPKPTGLPADVKIRCSLFPRHQHMHRGVTPAGHELTDHPNIWTWPRASSDQSVLDVQPTIEAP